MLRRAPALLALLLACRPTGTSAPGDPRDVTRRDLAPPMYSPGLDAPPMAITRNAYGATMLAPKAPQLGDVLPDFELPRARGGTWSLREARARGPVVVVFYRGFW